MAYIVNGTMLWLLSVVMTCCTVVSLCNPETSVPFRLELETDYCASETSWEIKDAVNDDIILDHGPYEKDYTIHNETYCVPSNKCLIFTMKDLYGEFAGYYKLFYDGDFFKRGLDFGFRDSTKFGSTCPTKEPTRSPTKSPTIRSTSVVKVKSSGENRTNKMPIILGTIGGVTGLVFIMLILYVERKRRKSDTGVMKPPTQIAFTYK